MIGLYKNILLSADKDFEVDASMMVFFVMIRVLLNYKNVTLESYFYI